jgi:glycine/serine hydroxymethyltransferase
MGLAEMREIAGFIDTVLAAPADAATHDAVRAKVRDLAARFPLYNGG